MMDNIYLNGAYLPLSEARISPMDRGFLFGDGVYEVIPVYAGKAFRLDEHLKRLQFSLEGIQLDNPLTNEAWQEVCHQLIQQRPGTDQGLYLQVTRGEVTARDHSFRRQDAGTPTVFAMCSPLKAPDKELFEKGVRAVTLDDIRWQYCHLKVVSLISNVLLRQQAEDAGGMEALLVRDGWVTEGAASNFFMVQQGVLVTPPKTHQLLPGITRDLILELADQARISVKEEAVKLETLLRADEVWLTSSVREILPVTQVDDTVIADGKPGPLWHKLTQLFSEFKINLHR